MTVSKVSERGSISCHRSVSVTAERSPRWVLFPAIDGLQGPNISGKARDLVEPQLKLKQLGRWVSEKSEATVTIWAIRWSVDTDWGCRQHKPIEEISSSTLAHNAGHPQDPSCGSQHGQGEKPANLASVSLKATIGDLQLVRARRTSQSCIREAAHVWRSPPHTPPSPREPG